MDDVEASQKGKVCDLLNPNNALYDPAFALEYAHIRCVTVLTSFKGRLCTSCKGNSIVHIERFYHKSGMHCSS